MNVRSLGSLNVRRDWPLSLEIEYAVLSVVVVDLGPALKAISVSCGGSVVVYKVQCFSQALFDKTNITVELYVALKRFFSSIR